MRFCPNRKHWSSQHKGFSLSELLVVVVIVGLTTAWSVPNIQRNWPRPKWIVIGGTLKLDCLIYGLAWGPLKGVAKSIFLFKSRSS